MAHPHDFQCVDIVVARHSEDLAWLQPALEYLASSSSQSNKQIQVFIYNKSPDTLPESCNPEAIKQICNVTSCNVVNLPNVGRESHTYLFHITSHYHKYASGQPCATVFLQGSPQDHMNSWYRGFPGVGQMIEAFLNETQQWGASLTWARKHETTGGNAAHYNFRITQHNGRNLFPLVGQPFGEWFQHNVGTPFAKHDLLKWWPAALFSVHSRLLGSRLLDSYNNLLALLSNDLDPEVGHFFERSWLYITGAHNNMNTFIEDLSSKAFHVGSKRRRLL